MTYYDLSFMDNVTGVHQVLAGVNTQSGGWLGGAFLIFMFVLIFIVFSEYDTKDLMLGDSFICTIIAGALYGAGMLAWWGVLPIVVLLVISLFIKLWSDA